MWLTTELRVDIQVLFVEALENRIEESTQWWAARLLNDFSSSLLRFMFRYARAELVHIHDIFRTLLVRASLNEG